MIFIFKNLTYLQSGNMRQRQAYLAIHDLNLMQDLAEYDPVLCGTIPINLDTPESDLDIVMEVQDFDTFEQHIRSLYGDRDGFGMARLSARDLPSVTVNFQYGGFAFELFGQPVPVEQQNAYRHMLVEYHLLNGNPQLGEKIIRLKHQGIKTEPAFARILGLPGDPYDELLAFGKRLGLL